MYTGKYALALSVSALIFVCQVYAAWCSLSCTLINRPMSPAASVTNFGKEPTRCHHGSDVPRGSFGSEQGSREQPCGNGSGDCPGHDDASVLIPAGDGLYADSELHVRTVALLPAALAVQAEPIRAGLQASKSLRSPPKRAVISVYRI